MGKFALLPSITFNVEGGDMHMRDPITLPVHPEEYEFRRSEV